MSATVDRIRDRPEPKTKAADKQPAGKRSKQVPTRWEREIFGPAPKIKSKARIVVNSNFNGKLLEPISKYDKAIVDYLTYTPEATAKCIAYECDLLYPQTARTLNILLNKGVVKKQETKNPITWSLA